MFNLISFILVIFPLIIIHEFGHFFVGKLLGAKPAKFAIGFGKILYKREHNGVEYSLRLLPIGGFVEFSTTQFPKLEKNKEYLDSWKWIFISLAGPLFNFLFTLIIVFLVLFLFREEQFLSSLIKSFELLSALFFVYFNGVWELITGAGGIDSLSGPVGIAKVSGEAVAGGFFSYLKSLAFLSFALGFMNLIPLTILDGGRALISLYETVFRTNINEKMFHYSSILSISLLIFLLLFSTYKDIFIR